jgi:hypothetical protein
MELTRNGEIPCLDWNRGRPSTRLVTILPELLRLILYILGKGRVVPVLN